MGKTAIHCANCFCKWQSYNGVCKRDKISLSLCGVSTVNQGFKHFAECKMFEEDESMEKIRQAMGLKEML